MGRRSNNSQVKRGRLRAEIVYENRESPEHASPDFVADMGNHLLQCPHTFNVGRDFLFKFEEIELTIVFVSMKS